MDTGQRQRTDSAKIRDYYAQSDGRRIFASMGVYGPAPGKAGGESEGRAGGSVVERGISGDSPDG